MSFVHELRVHGVHNTKPANMLGVRRRDCTPDQPDEQVRRVAGDDLTGFWQECSPKPLGRLISREAYSWGNINASPRARAVPSLTRAAWLLLLPYAFVNVGYWSRANLGDGGHGKRGGRPGAATFRLAGLLLTALFVTTATQIGADLIAWQCYVEHESRCTSLPNWLRFMEDLEPAQRLAVGCALPILVLLTLWLLSRQSLQRYEETPLPRDQDEQLQKPHLLESRGLWTGKERVQRLQRLHLAAGLSCVVIVTGWPAMVLAVDGPHSWLVHNLCAATLVLAACIVLALFQVADGPDYTEEAPAAAAWPGRALVVAVLLMLSHLLALGFGGADLESAGPLPGSGVVPLVLPILLVLIVLAVFLRTPVPLLALAVLVATAILGYVGMEGSEAHGAVWFATVAAGVFLACFVLHLLRCKSGENRFRGWGGSAPAVLLGAAVFFALLSSTAATLVVADRLNGGPSVTALLKSPFAEESDPFAAPRAETCSVAEHSADRFDVACTNVKPSKLAIPVVHFWLAAGLLLSLVSWLILVVVAYLLFNFSRLAREDIRRKAGSKYPPISGEPEDDPRRRFQLARVVATRRRAEFAHRAERIVGLLCPLTALSILLALAGALTRDLPWELPKPGSKPAAFAEAVGHASLVVVAAVALGIVALGAAAYHAAPLRGTLGVIWDLASFWPRAAHPFAPPCYAERAVPELCTRIRQRLRGDGRIVLSAHSLGSTLAVAAIFRFPPEDRRRIALLCYGSQLRAYFGRLFPAVFGADVLGNAPARQAPLRAETPYGGRLRKRRGTLAADLDAGESRGRWLNLYRRTDYLGFRVYGDAGRNRVDRSIRETRIPWSAGDPAPHPIETHGDYPGADDYDLALQQLIARIL